MSAPITTRLLRFQPHHKTTTLHHFSTIPTHPFPQPEPDSKPEPESKPKSPIPSYLNDIKSTLHNQPRTNLSQQNQEPISQNQPINQFPRPNQQTNFQNQPRTNFYQQNQPRTNVSQSESLQKVYANLSQFRSRTAPPPPSPNQYVSFANLFKNTPNNNAMKPGVDSSFLARYKDNSNTPSTPVGGGGLGLSGMGSKKGNVWSGFVFDGRPEELGRKLRGLRPEKRMGEWFSIQELSDRLVRLREIEEKENERKSSSGEGLGMIDIRNVILKLRDNVDAEEKMKVRTVQRLDTLRSLGGTPSYMLNPPKEDLVEQYFHLDNMSSAEKMKLELKKVRDEFKMSESDCGSARVQVAQLTTKIKHLSTVLAKKDKHSRKGLQAMVQKRKKLLKYLRRTDWDSYSLVLSKLGLRDNPDIKA